MSEDRLNFLFKLHHITIKLDTARSSDERQPVIKSLWYLYKTSSFSMEEQLKKEKKNIQEYTA